MQTERNKDILASLIKTIVVAMVIEIKSIAIERAHFVIVLESWLKQTNNL